MLNSHSFRSDLSQVLFPLNLTTQVEPVPKLDFFKFYNTMPKFVVIDKYSSPDNVVAKPLFSQECDSDGIRCISCTDYQTCNAGVPEGVVISCKNGKGCADDHLRHCQQKLSCFALTECTQNGIFPDPTDDTRFFVCLGDASSGFLKYEFTCPDEQFFDLTTQACVLKAATQGEAVETTTIDSTNSTTQPTTTTTEPTTTTTEPTNSTTGPTTTTTGPTTTTTEPTNSTTGPTTTTTGPTTTTTEPTNSTTGPTTTTTGPTTTTTGPTTTTTEPTNSTTGPTTTTTEPTTTTTGPTTTTIEPTTTTTEPTTTTTGPTTTATEPPSFVCTQPGTFPNPSNCKMYYRCSSTLKAFFYICPGSSYFNENIMKCSLIITPACKEQISKNSASTLPPVTNIVTTTLKTTTETTTPTTTTTSTPKPTTTTTSTPKPITTTTSTPKPTTTTTSTSEPTTTTPSTPCVMEGSFPHPADCKKYYRCSVSGKAFLYTCPGKTYFNELTKRCSLTITARCKALVQG